ncbi:MAG TPA: ABC transporter substrate-binding protein [Nocardioidaceae bacterium]|nr:ABC transporter substrate-binding protein [Nocardioidaceae bacterium]
MRARLFGSVMAAAALVTLSACGSEDSGGGSAEEGLSLVSEGTLTVCSDIPYPPFEMQQGGDYTGFDIDLMREIAQGMGLELEVQDVGFEGLQSGASLAAGQCDIGASAMTITEEREENLDFSESYYDSQQSLLVPSGSDITSIEDLAGKQVGVQQGTTGQKFAEENVPEGTKLIAYPSDAELYAAIRAGNIDAILQDLPVNLNHTRDGDFEIVDTFKTDEAYGFAVAEEGSEALLEEVNAQLQKLKDNGTYQEIFDEYFKAE